MTENGWTAEKLSEALEKEWADGVQLLESDKDKLALADRLGSISTTRAMILIVNNLEQINDNLERRGFWR